MRKGFCTWNNCHGLGKLAGRLRVRTQPSAVPCRHGSEASCAFGTPDVSRESNLPARVKQDTLSYHISRPRSARYGGGASLARDASLSPRVAPSHPSDRLGTQPVRQIRTQARFPGLSPPRQAAEAKAPRPRRRHSRKEVGNGAPRPLDGLVLYICLTPCGARVAHRQARILARI